MFIASELESSPRAMRQDRIATGQPALKHLPAVIVDYGEERERGVSGRAVWFQIREFKTNNAGGSCDQTVGVG